MKPIKKISILKARKNYKKQLRLIRPVTNQFLIGKIQVLLTVFLNASLPYHPLKPTPPSPPPHIFKPKEQGIESIRLLIEKEYIKDVSVSTTKKSLRRIVARVLRKALITMQ